MNILSSEIRHTHQSDLDWLRSCRRAIGPAAQQIAAAYVFTPGGGVGRGAVSALVNRNAPTIARD